jgi:lysophospholipase L1-like esterase
VNSKNKKTAIYIAAVSLPLFVLLLLRKKKMNPKGKLIAFIGDSHTAGYGWGWQSQLAKKYAFTEKNLAVGGKRTDWMVNVLTNYLATNKPDIVFIYGGANDAYSNVTNNTALKNIQKMVDLCNSKNIKPVVICGYNARKVQINNPNTKTTIYVTTKEGMWKLGEKFYQLQLAIQSQIKNAYIVPIWQGAEMKDAPDGLHITANAQKRFADYIGNYLFDNK